MSIKKESKEIVEGSGDYCSVELVRRQAYDNHLNPNDSLVLTFMVSNENLQQEMGQRNLQIAKERADWEKNFDILEGIYKNLTKFNGKEKFAFRN